jgi:hypothetical protein
VSEVRTLKIKSSLAAKLAKPGGRTLQEAERLAQAGLDARRGEVMTDIGGVIAELERICAAKTPGDEARVYPLSSGIIDLAGFFDTGPLYDAAYSLCDVSEQMTTSAAWRWPPVEVHVQTLRLIHAGGCVPGPQSAALLRGLGEMVKALG